MKTPLLLLLSLVPALLIPARAGLDISISADIRLGRVLPPPPPEVVVIVESPGPSAPPPWAPAVGVRRNRNYYYYPADNVYYRQDDRVWFYLDGGAWRFGASLPTNIRVDFDRSVSLTMDAEQPYQFHDKVRSYYPPDYFVTMVRMKERGNSGKAIHVREVNDEPSRGKGKDDDEEKGKGKGKGKNK